MNQGNDFNENQNGQGEGGSSPFSADLKSDFTSNFGTTTNAVSQIFKEGGFVGESKTRLIGIISLLIAAVVVGAFLLGPGEDDFDDDDFAVLDSEKAGDEKADKEDEDSGLDELGLDDELALESKDGEGDKTLTLS